MGIATGPGPRLSKHPPEGVLHPKTLVQAGCPPCPLPACLFPLSWPKRLSWSSTLIWLMNTELSTRRTLILQQNPPVSPAWTGKTQSDAFLRNNTSLLAQLPPAVPLPSLCREEAMVLSWSLTPGSCNSWSFPQAAAAWSQLQQLLQESCHRTSWAAQCPWARLPSPPQKICARSPGLSLSLGWSSTSTHRDTLPSPAVPATPDDWHSSASIPRTSAAPHRLYPCSFPDRSPSGLSLTPLQTTNLQQADVLSPDL